MWYLLAAASISSSPPLSADFSGEPYFPPSIQSSLQSCHVMGTNGPPPVFDEWKQSWYSYQLRMADEPSIYARLAELPARRRDVIRFTWLRSFNQPIFVRVEALAAKRPRLIAVQLTTLGGSVEKRVDRLLTPIEATSFRRKLSVSGFYNVDPLECYRLATDGAGWLIERVDEKGYRLNERWSPQGGAAREIGMALTAMTGWQVNPVY